MEGPLGRRFPLPGVPLPLSVGVSVGTTAARCPQPCHSSDDADPAMGPGWQAPRAAACFRAARTRRSNIHRTPGLLPAHAVRGCGCWLCGVFCRACSRALSNSSLPPVPQGLLGSGPSTPPQHERGRAAPRCSSEATDAMNWNTLAPPSMFKLNAAFLQRCKVRASQASQRQGREVFPRGVQAET